MKEELTKEQLEEKVEELELKVRVLEQDLIHDALTGLKTRKYFEEEAKKYFDVITKYYNGQRKEWLSFKHMSFIFFDIDHFKKVNDTHGHQTGDSVLKVVASTIKDHVRSSDIVARWGGEEMVVAFLGVDERRTTKKAEEIRRAIELLSFNNLPDISVTISAGVSAVEANQDFDTIIARADKALYEAKRTGRNKVVAWSELNL